MRTPQSGFVVLIFALLVPLMPATVRAQDSSEQSAAKFLPSEAALVVSIRDAGSRWTDLQQTELFGELMQLPQVQEGMQQKQFRNFQRGMTFIESMFGRNIPELLQDFTQNGATLAWKSEREFVLVTQPTDETYQRLRQTLKEFASAAALGNADQRQFFATTYRDCDAFGINQARIGFADGWVVVASASDIGKSVIDQVLGDGGKCLADQAWFQQARDLLGSVEGNRRPVVSALVNVAAIRSAGGFKPDRGADLGQELFFGGVFDAIETAPVMVAIADLQSTGLAVRAAVPRESVNEKMEFFFGPSGSDAAARPVDLPDRILSARWHRDIGLMWKMAPQLVSDENALAGIAKAESDLSTLLGGMVTIGDVFSFIGPELELVAVPPILDPAAGKPALQIPAFAVTGDLRSAENAQPAMRLAFQQVVSFANTNAGAGKYPPLEVLSEREAGTTLVTASYVQMSPDANYVAGAADLYKNFSPTLGFRGERFVLASHRDLAIRLLDASTSDVASPCARDQRDNTVLEIWPSAVAAVGELNRQPLIAQRMLSSGLDRAAAENDIDMALQLLKHFQSLRVRLATTEKTLVLDAALDWNGRD